LGQNFFSFPSGKNLQFFEQILLIQLKFSYFWGQIYLPLEKVPHQLYFRENAFTFVAKFEVFSDKVGEPTKKDKTIPH
jgi:hypothetical protein